MSQPLLRVDDQTAQTALDGGDFERLRSRAEAVARLRATAEFSMEGLCMRTSTAFAGLLGLRPDEVEGRSHERLAGDSACELWAAARRGEPARGVVTFRGKDGAERWFDAEYGPLVDGEGATKGVFLAVLDVTAEQLERARERRLTAVIEEAEAAIMMIDRDFIITYANKSTMALLEQHGPTFRKVWPGFDPTKVLGACVDQFHVDPKKQRTMLADPKRLPHRADIQVGPLTFNLLVTAIYGEDGQYAGNTLEWRDVTDLRRQEALNADFRGQIEAIGKSMAVIEFGMDGMVRDANHNFLATLGYGIEEIRAKHHSQFLFEEERQTAEYRQFWERLSRGEYQAGEFRRRAKDGSEIWIQASYNPILDVQGKPFKVVKFASDITDVKRMQREAAESAQREVEAAQELKSKVDSMLANVQAAGQGDLTTAVTVSGEDAIGAMGKGLGDFLGDLRQRVASIAENADSLAASSEEFAAVAKEMGTHADQTANQANLASAASEQVSRNVQTVATGTEEMSASIREIAKNASDAARVAAEAVTVAERANQRISKLGESSAEIGQVIKVITSIAQQTNLLALNATIEAARAGEAGKGFAVVANEVKELAKETARATEEIGQKIEAIQGDTQGAVGAIGEISTIIHQINGIQTTIAGAVEEQTATTNEMARNVAEAAAGTNEIAQSITAVAQAAQHTTSGASESERAAGELARMAAELQSLVRRFRTA